MGKIIAFCGLICNDCPAYIATKENNQAKKEELAKKWSSDNYIVAPDDINCDGCTSSCNNVFKFCQECEIRVCGVERSLKNCAYCGDYPCSKLEKPFEINSQNKVLLDEIKAELK